MGCKNELLQPLIERLATNYLKTPHTINMQAQDLMKKKSKKEK